MDYLKLLDMTEQEQRKWLVLHHILKYKQPQPNQIRWESLADLAFRLRDEAVQLCISWEKAKEDVWVYVCHKKPDVEISYIGFWTNLAKPIHWIVAALIAKGDE